MAIVTGCGTGLGWAMHGVGLAEAGAETVCSPMTAIARPLPRLRPVDLMLVDLQNFFDLLC